MNVISMSKLIFYFALSLLFLSLILIILKKVFKIKSNPKKKKRVKKYVDGEDTVYNAILVYPELEDYLYYIGVKSIKNPIVKKTFAKKTTFSKLASALGKKEDEFLNEINRYIEENIITY